jgi:hypothetical protein
VKPPHKFKPRYEDLPAHRREKIARHMDLAMVELQRAGREFNVPEKNVHAMWEELLKLPDNNITTNKLQKIYLKHAEK